MNASEMPKTRVRERMVDWADVLVLESQDGPQEAIAKGLYGAPKDQPVVIREGSEVLAIESAGRLRGEVLPRSWQAPIVDWIAALLAPAEVGVDTPVAELAFLVQGERDLNWALVVEGESGDPVGVLDRATIVSFLPPVDTTAEVYRGAASPRLWGDGTVRHYYYCPVEDRTYGPHAVRPDAQGRMRDRRGHLVERRAVSQES